jgi:hypothetical protein
MHPIQSNLTLVFLPIPSYYSILYIYYTVFITMVLAALATIYINTEESQAEGEQALSGTYNVYSTGNADNSNGQQLGESLINGIVIVSVICAVTFLIVLLYKYRCMKVLIGYMILASVMLLGFLSAVMFQVAIDRYDLRIDTISFYFFIYNFCITGTTAIFFAKGFPVYITQGYLIATSIIVSWQLSHFDAWTAWVLLVLLALYDLFAVLTPCGPLKALVKLMQQTDAPDMPGLLYEASLPANTPQRRQRPANTRATASSNSNNEPATSSSTDTNPVPPPPAASTEPPSPAAVFATPNEQLSTFSSPIASVWSRAENGAVEVQASLLPPPSVESSETSETNAYYETDTEPEFQTTTSPFSTSRSQPAAGLTEASLPTVSSTSMPTSTQLEETQTQPPPPPLDIVNGNPTASIPLALAKLYKLPLVDADPQPRWVRRSSQQENSAAANDDDANDSAADNAPVEYSPAELNACVEVYFPRHGGRIVPRPEQRPNEEMRYLVMDREGTHKRILFVNVETGRVFEDLRERNAADDDRDDDNDGTPERNSIRLGLGDFIFYSILVSKAALYSFTTFAACTLAILTGLGLTLLLLAVYGKALPALPISIFLGVTFYVMTRFSLQPWIQEIFIQECYV